MSCRKAFLFILVFILASFVRLWNLDYPDLISDELHYIEDAQRFSRGDPYISFRHHTFQHPVPNIGHPFLVPALSSFIYKLVGYSVSTARLPSVTAGLMTMFVLCFFGGRLSRRTPFLSATLFAIVPFAIRFNRDAHLDSFFTLWTTLVAFSIWRFHLESKKKWLVFGGLFSGLALSTKLDGVIALVLAMSLLFLTERRKEFRDLFSNLLFIIIPALGVWFLLNDPSAYLDGIFHPADQSFSFRSWVFWLAGLQSLPFWYLVMFFLLSPLIFFLWIFALYTFLKKRGYSSRFLLVWQIVLVPLFFLHRPGVSGEYGLLPMVPAISMSVAYILRNISIGKMMFLVLLIVPFSLAYGLRIVQVPYYPRFSIFNRTIMDRFYQDIVEFVNGHAPQDGLVFFLPKEGIPTFSLRTDIHWSYYGDPKFFDLFVVDNQNLVMDVPSLKQIAVIEVDQDGKHLKRYIYKKNNEAN